MIKFFSKGDKKDRVRDAALATSVGGATAGLIGSISHLHQPSRELKHLEKGSDIIRGLDLDKLSNKDLDKLGEWGKKYKRIKNIGKLNKSLIIGGIGATVAGTGLATYRNIQNEKK